MEKFFKPKIEFYITNVCNFNCDNCNRLNNYYFSGHDRWQDYDKIYEQWSQRINFGEISILGGEPLLNPTLHEWLAGTRRLWPAAKINILTNGSNLDYWYKRNFFDLLSHARANVWITLHNRDRRQDLITKIKSYLRSPRVLVKPSPGLEWRDAYQQVKDPSWPDCNSYDEFHTLPIWIQDECRELHKIAWEDWVTNTGLTEITDQSDEGIHITLSFAENFVTAPLQYQGHDWFQVYNSDPDAAHSVCPSKHCTHMMRGKIYKCHHVALLPDFAQQFQVNMSGQDRQLLGSYRPLQVDDNDDVVRHFLERHIKNTIPQCKLCPSELGSVILKSSSDKPKVKKIIPIQAAQV